MAAPANSGPRYQAAAKSLGISRAKNAAFGPGNFAPRKFVDTERINQGVDRNRAKLPKAIKPAMGGSKATGAERRGEQTI